MNEWLAWLSEPFTFPFMVRGVAAALIVGLVCPVLGAYVVQTGGALSWEPFVASIPVALLVALILYVNEIPDRRGDARVGKRTLPVRFSREAVITGYNVAVVAAYVALIVGVLLWMFDWRYVLIIGVTVALYMTYTYYATEWRIGIRRKMKNNVPVFR